MQKFPRRAVAILLAAGALALAACGPSDGTNSGGSFQQGFDSSFNKSFEKSTHDSCVSSATKSGAPADKAETYCNCMVAQLKDLPVKEKMALSPSSPKVNAAIATCRLQVR